MIAADPDPTLQVALQKILTTHYQVMRFVGSGGEADVFLIKDRAGKNFIAKYWRPTTLPSPFRGATPFQNAVEAYQALAEAAYMNTLVKIFDEKVMILDYVPGQELHKVLAENLSRAQLESIIRQVLEGLSDMHARGVMGFDTNAENILVDTKKEGVPLMFVDPGAYLVKDKLIARNKGFSKNDFSIYSAAPVHKLLKRQGLSDGKHYILNGSTYAILPPLTFYSILSERVDLLSALLTKLWYITEGRGQDFPQYMVENRISTFGATPENFVTPVTPEIQKRAEALLARARYDGKPLHYTEEDFKRDWAEAHSLFKALKKRTEECVGNIQACVRNSQGKSG